MQDTGLTRTAAADLSAQRYQFVGWTTNGGCNMATSASLTTVLGVLQNKPQSGEPASIETYGFTRITVGAAVSEGALIKPNTSGRAIASTSGTAAFGRALEAAAADGQVINAFIWPIAFTNATL